MIYMADVKDKDDKRSRLMLDGIEAKSEKEARKIAEDYGEIIKIGKMDTHRRCRECGKILKGSKGLCSKCGS